MTEFEFSLLSFYDKMDIMFIEAIEIAMYNDGINRYFLYQFDSFYIEGKFHIELKSVYDIETYNFRNLPEVYLEEIDVSGLLVG